MPGVPNHCSAVAAANFAAAKAPGNHFLPQSGRGLTMRSTGHFAAAQFWARKPSPKSAHRKVPVSFNVRPHPNASSSMSQSFGNSLFLVKSNSSPTLPRHILANAVAASKFAATKALGSFLPHQSGRGLTGRSTGHFAAAQFWARKPSPKSARRKVPVSWNVRRRLFKILRASKTPFSRTTFALHCRYSWRSGNQALDHDFFALHRLSR